MTFVNDPTRWTGAVQVNVPKSEALRRLLHGAGTGEQFVHALACAADPCNGPNGVVTLPTTPQARGRMGVADAVAAGLGEILNRTVAGTPGREELVFVASQLGVREVAPEPEPAPAAAPAATGGPTLA